MQQYATFFQICLAFYCVTSFGFSFSPLRAIAYFLIFRSAFAVAGFLQIPSIAGMQFFLPAILCLLLPAFISILKSEHSIRFNSPVLFYLLFIALMVINGFLLSLDGANLEGVIEEASKSIFPFLAYILVYYGLKNDSDFLRAGKYFMLIGIIPMLTAFASLITGIGYNYETDSFGPLYIAPAGTLIGRNLFGIFLALSLFHALPYMLQNKNKTNLLYILALIASIIISRNRGTWLSLLIAFMISLPLFKRHIKPGKWLLGLMAVVMLGSPVFVSRFSQLSEYDEWGQKQDTASGRLETAESIFNKAMESPLLGNGPFSFRNPFTTKTLPHNDYLRIACEYGFPVMFVYILFFISQLAWTIKHRNDRLWPYQFASCGAQIYIIIISMAQNVVGDTILYMLLFALIALSLSCPPKFRPVI